MVEHLMTKETHAIGRRAACWVFTFGWGGGKGGSAVWRDKARTLHTVVASGTIDAKTCCCCAPVSLSRSLHVRVRWRREWSGITSMIVNCTGQVERSPETDRKGTSEASTHRRSYSSVETKNLACYEANLLHAPLGRPGKAATVGNIRGEAGHHASGPVN